MPIAPWRKKILNDGDIPSRKEHVFAFEMEYDKKNNKRKFAYNKTHTQLIKEAYVTGYGIPHDANTCRTWDGRSPLQQCKFPFKVHVKIYC